MASQQPRTCLWTSPIFGPFEAQASRILFYLVCFLVGTAVGAYGLDRSMLKSNGPLARHWRGWLAAGLISFIVLIVLAIAIFLRFTTRRVGIFDSLAANAYGIYIVHSVFVTWLQYWLLDTDLSPIAKATLVFAVTLILYWGLIAAIRRVPVVAKAI